MSLSMHLELGMRKSTTSFSIVASLIVRLNMISIFVMGVETLIIVLYMEDLILIGH